LTLRLLELATPEVQAARHFALANETSGEGSSQSLWVIGKEKL
jgi:hypothetical protein